MSDRQSGFTIVELVIAITVAGFLVAAIFIATFGYFTDVSRSEASATLALESQTILTQMTEDIRLADAISSTNAITDPNAPTGGWVTSDPSNVIIIESPAVDSSRNIIYNTNTGFPYRNEFIYFNSGSSMYKRILANTSAAGNTQKTTCPSSQSSSSCPPDRLFSSNVSNLSFTFYDSSDNTTSNAVSARSVQLEVDMAKKVFGRNLTFANTTRVTLRNQ
jgi:prepilin-type N-terminal cleavage/methylation domain-containing protein